MTATEWTLGIDVACRAAHQATLAQNGATVWSGRKFDTRPADLDRLWADLDLGRVSNVERRSGVMLGS